MKRKFMLFLCKYLNIHHPIHKEIYKPRSGMREWWDECKYCAKRFNEDWDQ